MAMACRIDGDVDFILILGSVLYIRVDTVVGGREMELEDKYNIHLLHHT